MPPVKHYSTSEVNQYELSSRLLSLTENNTSYTLTQINGQRIYRKAPHAWSGPEPSRNCEVFIGRIPHDCFEDTLVPLFRQAGELFEFRLMINFSGWNRGYAFAMYTSDLEAANAIRLFNNYMIRPSWQLGVCPSINNCRIFISRIPPTTPSAEIVRLLYALTDEVQEVRVRRSIASCAAIVEYKSHRGAAMARKALVAAAAAAWGSGARPAVDWSLPQSPQLLKQYREIGRWSPERGVELTRAPEEPCGASPPPAAPSYTLEPWSQARRLRMIQEAQRNAAAAAEWSSRASMESLAASMSSLHMGLCLGAGERAVWAPPGAPPPVPRAPQPHDFNPWTTRHPMHEFMAHAKEQATAGAPRRPFVRGAARARYTWQRTLVCVACLVAKRVSQDDEARLALLLQKFSREWSLLTSVTWDSVGGAFADAIYGGYVIITFVLIVARVMQEIPKGRRILEGLFLGFGMLFFLVIGGLELASLDSVPRNLAVNASVLGSLSLVVAALFLIDLMGPRIYTATSQAQTDPISSPKMEKKVSIANPPTTNGHLPGEKHNGLNGNLPAERPKDLNLDKTVDKDKEAKKETKLLETSLDAIDGETKLNIDEMLEKTKFGSLRNGIEGGNYVRLSDPISEPDRLHYERELAKFNERYFRDFLDNFAGKLTVRENYLPEPHTPVFAKVKTGRLKSLYDEESPTYERNKSNYEKKSPPKAKTVPSPTLQQLEDYLKSSSKSRRADTPALFPMEPIEEKETTDTEGRASGTPTDPGYVQYTAGRWSDKHRELRTPRHSPT